MTTSIEWTNETLNAIRARNKATGKLGHFCIHVSDGCKRCYAETWQPFRGTGLKDSYRQSSLDLGLVEVFLDEKTLRKPLKWRKTKPRKVFWSDMTDLFGPWVPDEWIAKHYAVFALTPWLTHQVVTKRPERRHRLLSSDAFRVMVLEAIDELTGHGGDHPTEKGEATRERARAAIKAGPLPNVWELVSIENQQTANDRVRVLLFTPAAVRGVSAEPLLGPVDLTRIEVTGGGFINALTCDFHDGKGTVIAGPPSGVGPLDWVVTGGESGRGDGPRPMHPDWPRKLRDDCIAAGVAFFFKQWGAYRPRERCGRVIVEDVADPMHRPTTAWPDGTIAYGRSDEHGGLGQPLDRLGKKAAGRDLDGEKWSEFPAEGM